MVPCLNPLILIRNSLIFKSFTFHQNISNNILWNICNFLSLHGDFAAALEPQCLFYIILCKIVLSIPKKMCIVSGELTCTIARHYTLYIIYLVNYISMVWTPIPIPTGIAYHMVSIDPTINQPRSHPSTLPYFVDKCFIFSWIHNVWMHVSHSVLINRFLSVKALVGALLFLSTKRRLWILWKLSQNFVASSARQGPMSPAAPSLQPGLQLILYKIYLYLLL